MKKMNHLLMAILSVWFVYAGCGKPEGKQENNTAIGKQTVKEITVAEIYLTAEGTTNKLTKQADGEFKALPQVEENVPVIIVDASKTFQTLEGFGAALTDAAAETYYKLPEAKRNEISDAYFDVQKGIGYTFFRTNLNSCDFSSGSYAYAEAGDTLLANFSIEHDRKFKIPFIKEAMAKSGAEFQLFASPWSPPAWMKTNNHMLQGGKLLPQYFQTWANYYVKFIEEYKKEGIPMWGLTVQNEPMAVQTWESCIYTAEEERDFVKTYLGPTLHKAGMQDVKLIIWDHNRGIMYQRAKTVYDDPEASKYVWGTGFHWYVGDHFDNLKRHTESFPDKNLLFTEGCVYPFNYDSISNWHWGETYGRSLINDLNNGAVGWIDWNIILDETGGPNHVNNFCYAPVIGNTKTGEVLYMSSYYYLGHFSKFIRPGAKRVIASSNDDELISTAFVNTDGSIAVVVMNGSSKGKDATVWMDGKSIAIPSPAHSILTVVLK